MYKQFRVQFEYLHKAKRREDPIRTLLINKWPFVSISLLLFFSKYYLLMRFYFPFRLAKARVRKTHAELQANSKFCRYK